MIARQIYTSNTTTGTQSTCAFDGKSSRVCEFRRRNAKNTYNEVRRATEQPCPSSPKNQPDNELEIPGQTRPIVMPEYTMHLSTSRFDPTIVNTPPSEFMDQLKGRLQVYFSSA